MDNVVSLNSYDYWWNNILASTCNVTDKLMSNMRYLTETVFISKAIKFHFKGSYDKQNLLLLTNSCELYESRESSFLKFYMK